VKQSRIVVAIVAVAIAAAAAAPSRAQVVFGSTIGWGSFVYGPYWPYRYGPSWYGWAGPCGGGLCVDNPYLRRAIQRELAQLDYLRELEERNQRGVPSYARSLYLARGDWPPPTPEAHVQPAYRGSGEIRPEFGAIGQLRQDSSVQAR
jgi:hypothetical protein